MFSDDESWHLHTRARVDYCK